MSRLSPGDTARTLFRATVISAGNGLVAWRWLLAGLVFAVCAVVNADILQFAFRQHRIDRPLDAWDMFPGMLLNKFFVIWLFGLGFLLLVGDSYLRERERGAVALCVLRLPSRTLWWLSQVGALGLLAACFVGLGVGLTLLVGVLMAPPGTAPLLAREGLPGMYPWVDIPVPTFILLLAGYTAWALWIAGCAVVLLSVFIPRKATVPAAIFLWVVLSLPWLQPNYRGFARLLGLDYFLSVTKHDVAGYMPMSWHAYFAITTALLGLMAVAGSWRLRWEEL